MDDFDAEGISLDEALLQTDSDGLHAKRALCISCASAAAASMCGSVAAFLMIAIPEDLQYEDWQTSLLASSTFWGMWAGSFIGGLSCDALGPGRVMLLSLLFIIVFGAAPVVFPVIVIPARIMCGLALCTTYLSANTYVAEWASSLKRGPYLSALHIWIALGSIGTVLLAILLQMLEVGWKPLLVLSSIPAAVVLVVSARFVLASESPRWLLVSGPPGCCRRMLCCLARARGELVLCSEDGCNCGGGAANKTGAARMLPPISIQQGQAVAEEGTAKASSVAKKKPNDFSLRSRLIELVGMWWLLSLACTLAFCLNFGSKGSEIWVGSFVQSRGLEHLERVVYLCVQTGKIAGDLASVYLSNSVGRLRFLQFGFAVSALTTLGFVTPVLDAWAAPWLLSLAFLQGAGIDLLWCSLYMYLAEIFPTTVRSTGFGVSMGLGRFGGVLSTSIGNLVPSMNCAFCLYAASFGVGTLAAMLPAPETAQSSLADTIAN